MNEDIFKIDPLNIDEEISPSDFRQLSVSKNDIHEAQIMNIVSFAGRPVNIDEILIALIRAYDQRHTRQSITAKLYKLIKKNQLKSPKKGSYEPTDCEKNFIITEPTFTRGSADSNGHKS